MRRICGGRKCILCRLPAWGGLDYCFECTVSIAGNRSEMLRVLRDFYDGEDIRPTSEVDSQEQGSNETWPEGRTEADYCEYWGGPLPKPQAYEASSDSAWLVATPSTERMVGETNMTVAYVSGPMRGLPNFNELAFSGLSHYLRNELKWQVHNPAENFDGDKTLSYETYMLTDLSQVLISDAIVLLPGWHNSEGAKLELKVAIASGKTVYAAEVGADESWRIEPESEPFKLTEGIEETARRLVYGDRNKDYGPPRNDFSTIGRKWGATLSAHLRIDFPDIPPELVAVMMVDLKTSRQAASPHHFDSRVDVIGYELCLDRILGEPVGTVPPRDGEHA
jgi:hypothetical protein